MTWYDPSWLELKGNTHLAGALAPEITRLEELIDEAKNVAARLLAQAYAESGSARKVLERVYAELISDVNSMQSVVELLSGLSTFDGTISQLTFHNVALPVETLRLHASTK